MNHILIKLDINTEFITYFGCYTKGKCKKYIKSYRNKTEDLNKSSFTCPSDVLNKYLNKPNAKNIFLKFNDNIMLSTSNIKECICKYTICNLIYKLIL